MHIQIDKQALVRQLEYIARIATKHPTLPVLQCVHIEASGDVVTLSGTNLEMGISGSIGARIEEEGVVAVPSALFLQTLQLLRDDALIIKTEGDVLRIESRNTKSKLTTFAVSEFPTIPKLSGETHALEGALFALGIRTAAFAVSQSSIKPELGSVCVMQKKENTLTFVATDSFRLVEKTVSMRGVVLENPILIPQKNALEIARVIEGVGGETRYVVGEGQVAFFLSDGTYLTSRLTEGSFPDYVQIIPKEFVTEATVVSSDLLHALRLTNLYANTFLQVVFSVEGEKNAVVVTSENGEYGTVTEDIPATIDGDDLRVSFNQRYVSEPLAHIAGDSLKMRFAGIGRPMVMEGISDASLRYLVMPMNK